LESRSTKIYDYGLIIGSRISYVQDYGLIFFESSSSTFIPDTSYSLINVII